MGDLRNLDDEALHALSQKAPKNAKYNFYVDLGEQSVTTGRIFAIR